MYTLACPQACFSHNEQNVITGDDTQGPLHGRVHFRPAHPPLKSPLLIGLSTPRLKRGVPHNPAPNGAPLATVVYTPHAGADVVVWSTRKGEIVHRCNAGHSAPIR